MCNLFSKVTKATCKLKFCGNHPLIFDGFRGRFPHISNNSVAVASVNNHPSVSVMGGSLWAGRETEECTLNVPVIH